MVVWETIFFWFFAIGAVLSSVAVIALRTPLYSAIALILDFFFFAGLYVLLSAHFMAVIQILVYGGAIMVLFMFIIMLLNLREEEGPIQFRIHHGVAALACMGLLALISTGILALVNAENVTANRAAVASQEGSEVATESRIPGLYGDLNEEALQNRFQQKIAAWDSGTSNPAEGKYKPFPGATFEVPPMMKGGEVNRQQKSPAEFGTVEPMSLLLVNRFVVPFELTALLLLGAIIGAVIIAKKRV